ncbi:hypothetical protein [Kineococcus arenarius]|uniref:hypothetical protein n=1 Tax=unclassified Kineococcus TaxID=2621656 RepID=UPI003D7E8379
MDGLHLVACTPGAAWCAPRYPLDEVVFSRQARPTWGLPHEHLVRIDASGRARRVEVDRPVSWVCADEEALHVRVWEQPWHLEPHADAWRVVYSRRWLRLPHDAPVPGVLAVDTHAVPDELAPSVHRPPPGALRLVPWSSDDPRHTFCSGRWRWSFGWSPQRPDPDGLWRRVNATARDEHTGQERRFDLGEGRVSAALPVSPASPVSGDGLLLAIERRAWGPWNLSAPVQVLRLDTSGTTQVLLPADSVDITGRGWPRVQRPVDADAYEQRMHNMLQRMIQSRHPWVPGVIDATVSVDGAWPYTHLVLTCRLADHPAVVLCRREPLYDELGRIAPAPHAGFDVMSALERGDLPPVTATTAGVLHI